jgi:spermidine synthase
MKQFAIERIDDCDEGVRHHYEVLETLVDTKTSRQHITIDNLSRFGLFVTIDGWPQVAESDSDRYHEALVHAGLINRLKDKNDFTVCLLGGGDFGAAYQLNKYPNCKTIKMVDWDLEFMEITKKHLKPIHHDSWKDTRVDIETKNCDVFEFFKVCTTKYDVVFGDLTDLTSLGSGVSSFVEQMKGLLKDNGTFVSQASEFPTSKEQIAEFKEMLNNVKTVFKHLWIYRCYVPSFAYEQAFIIGSDNDEYDPLSWSISEVDDWIKHLNGSVTEYSGRIHQGMFGIPNYLL